MHHTVIYSIGGRVDSRQPGLGVDTSRPSHAVRVVNSSESVRLVRVGPSRPSRSVSSESSRPSRNIARVSIARCMVRVVSSRPSRSITRAGVFRVVPSRPSPKIFRVGVLSESFRLVRVPHVRIPALTAGPSCLFRVVMDPRPCHGGRAGDIHYIVHLSESNLCRIILCGAAVVATLLDVGGGWRLLFYINNDYNII